jgi:hypothetical protein
MIGELAEPRQRLITLFKDIPETLVTEDRVTEKVFLSEMAMSTFCLCPRSLTLWTHRLVQSILSGCIPVLIDDGSAVYPFESTLDYRTFSVRASPERYTRHLSAPTPTIYSNPPKIHVINRLSPLVDIITTMTAAELSAKQKALWEARAYFLFPNNGTITWNAILDQVTLRLERKEKALLLPPTVNAVVDDGSPYSFEVDIVFTWSNTNDTRYTSIYDKHGPPGKSPLLLRASICFMCMPHLIATL